MSEHQDIEKSAHAAGSAGDMVRFCCLLETNEKRINYNMFLTEGSALSVQRMSANYMTRAKWFNGKTLRYYFFGKFFDCMKSLCDSKNEFITEHTLTGGEAKDRLWPEEPEKEKEVIRRAFQIWKDVGIGLDFKEVMSIDEAHIRIGFVLHGISWSLLGAEILDEKKAPKDCLTMNFGWSLLQEGHNGLDTAIHEIGHTLGFNHEHQNPNAGIEWNEQAVIDDLRGLPNFWPPEKTRWNILRKIPLDQVQGSRWDPNSIMHYPFKAGMINKPEQYRNGLTPIGGLSEHDKAWVKYFYPPTVDDLPVLGLLEGRKFIILPGQEVDFSIEPKGAATYQIQTFGKNDVIMCLDEMRDGVDYELARDVDSGHGRNAFIKASLSPGKKYVLRVRFCYSSSEGQVAVMMSEAWN